MAEREEINPGETIKVDHSASSNVSKPAAVKPMKVAAVTPAAKNDTRTQDKTDAKPATADETKKEAEIKEEEPLISESEKQRMRQKYGLELEPKGRGFRFNQLSAVSKIMLGIVGAALFGIVLIWLRHAPAVDDADQASLLQPVASVTATLTSGDGAIDYSTDGVSFTDVGQDAEIAAGSYLRTGDDSNATITLSDGSAIRLDSRTVVQMRTIATSRIFVAISSGQAYFRVIDNQERSFEVQANSVVFASLGTAFRVKSQQTGCLDYVEAFNSSVGLSDKEVSAAEGQSMCVTADGEEIAGLDFDKIKNDAFILWNIEQDKNDSRYSDALGVLSDLQPPALTIDSPKNNASTEEELIKINGSVDEESTVTVNDTEVTLDNNAFSTEVALSVGENVITVTATDKTGNQTTKKLTITRAEPKVEGITLEGSVGDNGIVLSWVVSDGVKTSDGFQVVYAKSGTPAYGTDAAQFTDDPQTVLPFKNGQTYKINVCVFNKENSTCSDYSNVVTVTAPDA